MTELALTPAERRRSLAIAIACTSVVGTTMGLTWPLLALILDAKGVHSTLVGLSSASQSLAMLAVAPIATRLIARPGAVRTITSSSPSPFWRCACLADTLDRFEKSVRVAQEAQC